MELSLFLAKLLGIYLLLVALLWAIRGEVLADLVDEFFGNRGLIFMSGLLSLLAGIAVAISHSVWELSWRGLLTLFGYMAILKGVSRIGFPELSQSVAPAIMQSGGRWVWIGLAFVLGAWLTIRGFGIPVL